VINVPDAPIAVSDSTTVAEDSGTTIMDVLANDHDVDNQPVSNVGLIVTAVGPASHGSTAFSSSGVSYTPDPNYYGPDFFSYTIADPDGLTSTAVVSILVTNVPDAPVAVDETVSLLEGSAAVGIPVLLNDYDVDNRPVSSAGLFVSAVGAAA